MTTKMSPTKGIVKKERHTSLPQYKKQKIKMLERDFCINLSKEDIKYFDELKNEIQVDQYTKGLLKRMN